MSASEALLEWYRANRRDLPWRRSRDPYRIWLSEIMLQQTQVTTALPYYEAFLNRFPTVEVLAEAPLEDVLAHWSGLGYYRRARYLHQSAKRIAEAGTFPSTSQDLLQLPGIGPYTAAAIASIAFDEVIPVLDGNVERVICRWLADEGLPKKAAVRRRLLAAAESLLDRRRPGDSNQALMELGATVCRPSRPMCPSCPLSQTCLARQLGDPVRFPTVAPRRASKRMYWTVAVAMRQDRVLLYRRSEESDLMPGLWELPTVELETGHRMQPAEEAFGKRYGGRWTLVEKASEVRHGITHRSITLQVFRASLDVAGELAEGPEAAWATAKDRDDLPTSSMVEKVLMSLSGC